MHHGIILEPDRTVCAELVDLLGQLDWTVKCVSTLSEVEGAAKDAWACFVCLRTGDNFALTTLARIREANQRCILIVLVDTQNDLYENQLGASGADKVFVKPADHTAIIDAVVKGMLERRF